MTKFQKAGHQCPERFPVKLLRQSTFFSTHNPERMKNTGPHSPWLGFVLGFALLSEVHGWSQPTNDLFANRLPLEGTNLTVQGNNYGASIEPGEKGGNAGSQLWYSVWYSWTAPTNGVVYFTGAAGFCLSIGTYRGTSVSTLVAASGTPSGGVPVSAGDTIELQIASIYYPYWGGCGGSGSFTLSVRMEVPTPISPNDAFADRIEIVGPEYQFQGSLFGATNEPGEPLASSSARQTLWWKFHAPADGRLSVIVNSGDFAPVLAFYAGTNLASLAAVTPFSTSPYAYQVQGGRDYAFQLSSASAPLGGFTLYASFDPATTDFFATSFHLEGTNIVISDDNCLATSEPGEPKPDAGSAGKTLWYSWAAPFSGRVSVTSHSSFINRSIAVYTGDTLETLRLVAVGRDGMYFRVEEGTVYHWQLDGADGGCAAFSVNITATPFLPATNDLFALATVLKGTGVEGGGAFVGATVEPGEPRHLGATPCRSLWWHWQVAVNGSATLRFAGGLATNVVFAIYVGDTVESLALVAKGTNSVGWNAVMGTTYRIAAVVPEETPGDVGFLAGVQVGPTVPVSGNLLCEGSFEGTNLRFSCWRVYGSFGGYVNEPGGADGSTWVTLLGFSWLLTPESFVNVTNFLDKLILHADPVLDLIWSKLDPADVEYILSDTPDRDMALIYGLDTVLCSSALWDPVRFAGVTLSPATTNLLAQNPHGDDLLQLNRRLLKDAFPNDLVWEGPNRLVQDFPTVPGRYYQVRFAFKSVYARFRVLWDELELGVAEIPAGDGDYWHWATFTATATRTNSQLTIADIGGNASLDAVSVVWPNEPPALVQPPQAVSVLAGGNASFLAGVSGSPPLRYQWFFKDSALADRNGASLLIENVSTNDAGDYHVVVTNFFGAVTSAPVVLVVEQPSSLTLVLQPYGDTVAAGGYFAFSVVAIGTPPLCFQWYSNGVELAGATNRQLVFDPVQFADAGIYAVKVWNHTETVWSLPARLTVGESAAGGGALRFSNKPILTNVLAVAPIFDVDGVTRLSGAAYVAQLYAGNSMTSLRAVGAPSPFLGGFSAGFFRASLVTLPTVPPGSNAFVQVRVWESAKGASYEEARALGSRFGRSEVLFVRTSMPPAFPSELAGLSSFALQAGLPEFNVGRVSLSERREDGTVVWSLQGQAGFRYVVEKAAGDFVWRPLTVLTNLTGAVTFIDPDPPLGDVRFYRARILD